jgi:hypothetical protein
MTQIEADLRMRAEWAESMAESLFTETEALRKTNQALRNRVAHLEELHSVNEDRLLLRIVIGLTTILGLVDRKRYDIVEHIHHVDEAPFYIAQEIELCLEEEMPVRGVSGVVDAICKFFDLDAKLLS